MAQSKSVVITGATGGVGARLVDRFLREGLQVFAAARRPGTIGRDGVAAVQLDLESSDSVAAAAETIIAQLGLHGLDALINCAGVHVDSPVELIPDDELRRAFEVNVIGPISLTRRLLPSLRAAHGRIVNIGAISAQTTPPFVGAARQRSPHWHRSMTRCAWSAPSLASKLS
jgi:NAD(P)-dependent dehydrogenase (short-subunit alcohol dehydrogenase family)